MSPRWPAPARGRVADAWRRLHRALREAAADGFAGVMHDELGETLRSCADEIVAGEPPPPPWDDQLRRLRDQANAEVRAAHAQLRAAERRVDLTDKGRARAEQVAAMERRRFELGSAELFTVLLREEKVAKARKAAVDAVLASRLAEAELVRASGGHPSGT